MKIFTEHPAFTCVEDQMAIGVTKATTRGRWVAITAAVVAKSSATGASGLRGEQEIRTDRRSAGEQSGMRTIGASPEMDQRCTEGSMGAAIEEKNSSPIAAETSRREKPAHG
jgi:hypothetical protein